MAASSRCRTNQFSTQPAMMLDVNSSTPVKAANSSDPPQGLSESMTCRASFSLMAECPKALASSSEMPSTAGKTMSRLPRMAATCERTRCVSSSTNSFSLPSASMSLSLAAMAGAVIAGCLVATVKCSNCTSTKLAA
ncbi:hypothetical protein SDC9_141628 [bioreactor metagenome]|uniref:Uncharacterized protein n=1 Tax=bioreactor metagenome TaxID=1076179 RepID=A0A645E1M1_9ZZZZ